MLNFLGVESNFSVISGMQWTSSFLFRDDLTGAPTNLDGVTFTGSAWARPSAGGAEQEYKMKFTRATADDMRNVIEVDVPALPEGRWRYAIMATDDSGASTRLLNGFITALGQLPRLNNDSYAKRTLILRMPSTNSEKLQVEWAATTVAEFYAGQSEKSADRAQNMAEVATNAAKKARQEADRATEQAGRAQTFAGQASNSAAKAKESETNAKDSADAASKSATASQTSAQQAAESATRANNSDQSAQAQARAATESAKQAATSASNARSSASAAATSAGEAAKSAEAAAASAKTAGEAAKEVEDFKLILPEGIDFNKPIIGLNATGKSFSVVIGQGAKDEKGSNLVIGKEAKVTGESSIYSSAIGNFASVTARSATAIGNGASNRHDSSALIHVDSIPSLDFYLYSAASDLANNTEGKAGMSYTVTDPRTEETKTEYIALEDLFNPNPLPEGNNFDNPIIGAEATGNTMQSVVLGAKAKSLNPAGTAVGYNASAQKNGSIALGWGAISAGNSSTAIGVEAKAELQSSVAIAPHASATGAYSVAIGEYASSNEDMTVAIGQKAKSQSPYSIAIGVEASATNGNNNIAIGNASSASSNYSIAIGVEASATNGNNNIAIGNASSASSNYSIAIGDNASASGVLSTAIGHGAVNENSNSVLFQFGTADDHEDLQIFFYDKNSELARNSQGKAGFAYRERMDEEANWHYTSLEDLVNPNPLPEGNDFNYPIIGLGARGDGAGSVVLGAGAYAKNSSIAIGLQAQANAYDSIVISSGSKVVQNNSPSTCLICFGTAAAGLDFAIFGADSDLAETIGNRAGMMYTDNGTNGSSKTVALEDLFNVALSGGGDGDVHKADLENVTTAWDAEVLQGKYKEGDKTLTHTGTAACNLYWFQVGETHLPNVKLISKVKLYCRQTLAGSNTTDPIYLGIWQEESTDTWKRVATSLNTQTQTNGAVMEFTFLATPVTGKLRFCPLAERFAKWPSPPTINLGLLVDNTGVSDKDTFVRTELSGSTNPTYLPKIDITYAEEAEANSELPNGNNFQQPVLGTGAKGTGIQAVAYGQNANATGFHSLAIGNAAFAIGTQSIAIGEASASRQTYSIAIGQLAQNDNNNSIMFQTGGIKPDLKLYFYGSDSSLATNTENKAGIAYTVGEETKQISLEDLFNTNPNTNPLPAGNNFTAPIIGKGATGSTNAVTIGENASASISSTAVGFSASASNDSIAIGVRAKASGSSGTVVGTEASSVDNSIAIGCSAKGTKNRSITIGAEADNQYGFTTLLQNGAYDSSQNFTGLQVYFYGPESKLAENTENKGGMAYKTDNDEIKYISFEKLFAGGDALPEGNNFDDPIIGEGASATGSQESIAIGRGASLPSCYHSIAIGANSGGKNCSYSTVIGTQATSTAINTIIVGGDSHTNGENSIVIGYNSRASFSDTISIGNNNTGNNSSTGMCSVAIGSGVQTGQNAIAIGYKATAQATAQDSVVLGYSAEAKGPDSTSIGYQAVNEFGHTALIQVGNGLTRLKFYIFGPKSPLAELNTDGEAGIGYISGDKSYVEETSGCIKLSELLTSPFSLPTT